MILSECIIGWIWDRRWPLAAFCALITMFAGWQAAKVGVDNSLKIWFVEDNPHLVAYRKFQERFGNDEVVVIAVHKPDGIATHDGLALLRRVEAVLSRVDGVASVVSIANHIDATFAKDQLTAALSGLRAPPSEIGRAHA